MKIKKYIIIFIVILASFINIEMVKAKIEDWSEGSDYILNVDFPKDSNFIKNYKIYDDTDYWYMIDGLTTKEHIHNTSLDYGSNPDSKEVKSTVLCQWENVVLESRRVGYTNFTPDVQFQLQSNTVDLNFSDFNGTLDGGKMHMYQTHMRSDIRRVVFNKETGKYVYQGKEDVLSIDDDPIEFTMKGYTKRHRKYSSDASSIVRNSTEFYQFAQDNADRRWGTFYSPEPHQDQGLLEYGYCDRVGIYTARQYTDTSKGICIVKNNNDSCSDSRYDLKLNLVYNITEDIKNGYEKILEDSNIHVKLKTYIQNWANDANYRENSDEKLESIKKELCTVESLSQSTIDNIKKQIESVVIEVLESSDCKTSGQEKKCEELLINKLNNALNIKDPNAALYFVSEEIVELLGRDRLFSKYEHLTGVTPDSQVVPAVKQTDIKVSELPYTISGIKDGGLCEASNKSKLCRYHIPIMKIINEENKNGFQSQCLESLISSINTLEIEGIEGVAISDIVDSALKKVLEDNLQKKLTDMKRDWDNTLKVYLDQPLPSDCDSILGSWLKDFLNGYLFFGIKVVSIILLIVMSMLEFIRAITASEDTKMQKAIKNTGIRILIVIAILMLPTMLNLIFNLLELFNINTCGIS